MWCLSLFWCKIVRENILMILYNWFTTLPIILTCLNKDFIISHWFVPMSAGQPKCCMKRCLEFKKKAVGCMTSWGGRHVGPHYHAKLILTNLCIIYIYKLKFMYILYTYWCFYKRMIFNFCYKNNISITTDLKYKSLLLLLML